MRSAVLCRSLNNSVWFRFNKNVQHFRFDTWNLHRCFRCTNWTTKKKLLHTLYNERTHNFFFAWKSHTIFPLHKKTTQNCTCTWAEHSTIISSWMLKCNASAVVVVAEKCEYHRTCCDYLVAVACQNGSAWNERKKLQHFYQLVVNMVWDLWKNYARTFRCLALLRLERTSGKGAMRAIVGSNL